MRSKETKGPSLCLWRSANTRMGLVIGEGFADETLEERGEALLDRVLSLKSLRRGPVCGVDGKADRSRGVSLIFP